MQAKVLKFRYFNSEKFVHSDDFSSSSLQSLALFFESALKYSDGKIQQFTGLTDKNGRDIYESDIVRAKVAPFSDEEGRDIENYKIGVIEFHLQCFAFNSNGNCYSRYIQGRMWDSESSEIIGNIFQNRSFLSEKAS